MKNQALAPLAHPVFRALWTASLVSNIGTWMQNVGASWLMTSLGPTPLLVALVQTATSLPVFLMALPAGALADAIDRRKVLLVTQSWMLAAAAVLGLTTLLGATTPWVLLALTFALGLGAAANAPAWQAIVPELVPREQVVEAVALNSVSFNLARAAGPALGGLVLIVASPGVLFLLNAVSFVGVQVVLYRWQRPARVNVAGGAIREGLRYVGYDPTMRAIMVRLSVFILSASAIWAVLPLLARLEIGHGSAGYGLLVASMGLGAVLGAALLARVRHRVSIEALLAGSALLHGGASIALSYFRNFGLVSLAMVAAGVAWISQLSTLNATTQNTLPFHLRARGLAVYLLIFQGGMALGSMFWGGVAERMGMAGALLCAGLAQAAGIALTSRLRLHSALSSARRRE